MATAYFHIRDGETVETRVSVCSPKCHYVVCNIGDSAGLFFPDGQAGADAARAMGAALLRAADEHDAVIAAQQAVAVCS